MGILVMNYYENGSMEKFDWKTDIDIYKSAIKQIICALTTAYVKHGFIHNDSHLGNFLIKHNTNKNQNKKKWEKGFMYEISPTHRIILPFIGIETIIIDFDNGLLDTNGTGIRFFFDSIRNVISRINLFQTPGLLLSENYLDILRLITDITFNSKDILDVLKILPMIDELSFRHVDPPSYVYDPFKFGGKGSH
jgi:hypothetical protein